MVGLIRVIIIVILALLVYRLLKRWLAKLKSEPKKKPANIDRMVRCHYCDLHIPETEAIQDRDGWYCSEEHRKLDQPAD